MENFFRIHFRHIKLFEDLEILSLSANSTFKTLTSGVDTFSELVFFKLNFFLMWNTLQLLRVLRFVRVLIPPPHHLYLGPAGLGEGCGVGRAELNSIQSNILSSAKPSIAKQCLVILIYLYIYTSRA